MRRGSEWWREKCAQEGCVHKSMGASLSVVEVMQHGMHTLNAQQQVCLRDPVVCV